MSWLGYWHGTDLNVAHGMIATSMQVMRVLMPHPNMSSKVGQVLVVAEALGSIGAFP
jgi:hypothetical protein